MSWCKLIVVLAVLWANFQNALSLDFQCSRRYATFDYVRGGSTACTASDLRIDADDFIITKLNGKVTTSDWNCVEISRQFVKFLPKGLDKFFPNLQGLRCDYSSLKSIKQKNLKPFMGLEQLDLSDNEIEMLDSDLFNFNVKLRSINLSNNKFKVIGEDVLTPLKSLNRAIFQNSHCIDSNYYSNFESSKKSFQTRCTLPQEITTKLGNLEENLRQEQINHETYKTLLFSCESRYKSCDGNLDAAGENFWLTSKELTSCLSDDSFVQLQTEARTVSVQGESDGTQFNATSFHIKFNNTRVDTILKTRTSGNATSLEPNVETTLTIHEQQTLFLPANLAQMFEKLVNLSVTSSGLMQIDSSVFQGMRNLTELNLRSNKLIEIPVNTFDGLINLKHVDLSMNNLKTLEHDVFKNLIKLSKLQLNDNYLETINFEVLQSLKNLKEISLENNQLKFISANLFTPLTQLTSAIITNNICIDSSFPNITMKDIEAKIIDGCIEPIGLDCKSTIKVLKLELTVVQTVLICEAELVVNYPKTKIANLTSFHATKEGVDNNVIVFSAINQTMKFLPYQLSKTFPKLTMIFIERSKLTSLQKHDFEGFTKLKKIIVHHNNLTALEEGTFDDVVQIEELNLSFNEIEALPPKIFLHLTKLKTLIMSNNKLTSFTADLLPRTNSLQEFFVDNNQLEMIETKTLRFLRKATKIDLSANNCIDRKFEKSEGNLEALLKLSGEIDLFCSADDLNNEE